MQAHWRDDADHADPLTLIPAGYDGDHLLDRAKDPEILAVFKRNTKEAIARTVFGSPTYFVDGDMFYGQNRLKRKKLRESNLDNAH